jgi:nucleoside-diphosphate-sugar epimerase
MADKSLYGRYEKPLANCDAVFHAATPLSPKFQGKFDGMRDMLNPGMEGTKELLETILKSPVCSSIQCLVLTSSMSAAAPFPEPRVKDESHWSDDSAQLSRGNFYGCLKTRQERLCQQWSEQSVQEGKLSPNFRFCAICPTMIVGPPLLLGEDDVTYTPSGTMGSLYRVIKPSDDQGLIGQAVKVSKRKARNDSMSYIHVQGELVEQDK